MPSNEIVLRHDEAMKLGKAAGQWTAKSQQMLGAGTSLAAALGMGFLRGKYETGEGTWALPGGTNADLEGVVGAALLALGISGLPDDLLPGSAYFTAQAGLGITCHYLGQVGRKSAKAGKLVMVAGEELYPEQISGEFGACGEEFGADPEGALRSALSAVP